MNNRELTPRNPGREALYFLLLVVLIFLLRSLWTHPIEHGDALQKYFWAAQIVRTGDWGLLLHNHHTMRWAVMLPQTALTWLLGIRYELFYVLPLLLFSAYLTLMLFSLRKILSVSQLLLLATVLFVEPWGFVTSNQLLNPPGGVLFACAGTLLLARGRNPRWSVVWWSAFLFFCAYGVHATYLSFSAGAVIWLVCWRRNWTAAALFCLSLIVLVLVEIVVFNVLSDGQLSFGRLEALAGGRHASKVESLWEPIVFIDLFERWLRLLPVELLLCLAFALAGPWMWLEAQRGQAPPGIIVCTYLVGLAFALGITFAVVSLVPIKPMMPLLPMYLAPFLPFAAIMTVYLWTRLVRRVQWGRLRSRERAINGLAVIVLLAGYALIIHDRQQAMLWHAEKQYSGFAERFRQGELILTGKMRKTHALIARFKYPVKLSRGDGVLSVPNPSASALCVRHLSKIPLQSNYRPCAEMLRESETD